jgi:Raf kinase inhibitor-like YbhB/YbcL family protein
MASDRMTIDSPAFGNGQEIPGRYTEDGADASPALAWANVPPGARELALICDDPDAPTDTPWVHWVVCNIPADGDGLREGAPATTSGAAVVEGANSWGTIGYRGPAPPRGSGVHHYRFRLFALDAPVRADQKLDRDRLMRAMSGHLLAEAQLVGLYRR